MLNIDQIKSTVTAKGSHFFKPATMRFFRSRTCSRVFPVPGGCYFVTGETAPFGPRRYTVRFADFNGGCGTAEGMQFQQFRDRRTALAAARFLAHK